jgi:phosphoribosylanthranilate isomerase
MRESQNILALAELKPDFMGFIFYEQSARFTGNILDKKLLNTFPKNWSFCKRKFRESGGDLERIRFRFCTITRQRNC